MRRSLATAAVIIMSAALARATTLYSNGFEAGDPGSADFYDSTTNVQGANISVVSNGGGALGLTAATGTHYAEITNTDDAYTQPPPGYGESVYTDYGAGRTGSGVVSGGTFYESTAYYLNTDWAAPSTNAASPAFWIDTTPNTDPGYLDENSFQVFAPGTGSVQIGFVGAGPSLTINSSGWYTFKTTFQEGPGSTVENVLSVIDSGGNVLGSSTYDSTLPFAALTGTNYGDWTTVWQNGFGATNAGGSHGAADILGIDDVKVGTLSAVPLPASAWSGLALLGVLATFGGVKRLHKQMA